MQKLNNNIFRILALAGLVFIYSCGEDDPVPTDPPVVSYQSGDFDDINLDYQGEAGDEVSATFSVSATEGINVVRISKAGGVSDSDFPMEVFVKDVGEDGPPTAGPFTFTYTLVEEEIGQTVEFDITAVEDTDDARTDVLTLSIETLSPQARTQSAILLFVPLGDLSAQTFFSTNTGLTYSPEEVIGTTEQLSKEIDFGYYEGTGENPRLASPLAFDTNSNAGLNAQTDNWNTINDTNFRITALTDSEFLELQTFADIDDVYEAGVDASTPNNIDGLAVGDIVAFQTDADKDGGSKRGVLHVTSITIGTPSAFGRIELEMIVQEPND